LIFFYCLIGKGNIGSPLILETPFFPFPQPDQRIEAYLSSVLGTQFFFRDRSQIFLPPPMERFPSFFQVVFGFTIFVDSSPPPPPPTRRQFFLESPPCRWRRILFLSYYRVCHSGDRPRSPPFPSGSFFFSCSVRRSPFFAPQRELRPPPPSLN